MDKNIGYAVITTEEYKEMIEDIINKKECMQASTSSKTIR